MEFGIGLPMGGGDWSRMIDEAQLAESLGLDAVWMNDHFLGPGNAEAPQFEAWTALAGIAAVTNRVRVGHAVNCVSFRNVGMFSKAATTADHISKGRLEIGLGAGWFEREYTAFGYDFPTPGDRVSALVEYLEALDLLFTAEPVDYEGRFVTLDAAVSRPAPVQQPRPPIVIGTSGPRMLGITGKYADTWNCPAKAIPDLEERRSLVMAAGRPVRTTLQIPAAPGSTGPGARAAREAARRDLAWAGDIDEIGLVGTIDEVVDRALAYHDRGVDGFVCLLPGGAEHRPALEALGGVAEVVRRT